MLSATEWYCIEFANRFLIHGFQVLANTVGSWSKVFLWHERRQRRKDVAKVFQDHWSETGLYSVERARMPHENPTSIPSRSTAILPGQLSKQVQWRDQVLQHCIHKIAVLSQRSHTLMGTEHIHRHRALTVVFFLSIALQSKEMFFFKP